MMKILVALIMSSQMAYAYDFGDLKESDQKYFKNEMGQGNNKLERIDLNVKEINKLWAEVNKLKGEVNRLRDEITQLKGQRK